MPDLTPARLRELADTCNYGETMRQAADALERAVELKYALLAYFRFVDNSGNWCDSNQEEYGSAWHISMKEHEEMERLEKAVIELLGEEASAD